MPPGQGLLDRSRSSGEDDATLLKRWRGHHRKSEVGDEFAKRPHPPQAQAQILCCSALFGRRASCHRFKANPLGLLLAALAYTLLINLCRLAVKGTELAQACTATIRTKLLSIGSAIVRNTRRVRVLLASAHPMKRVFVTSARALTSP